MYRNLEKGFYYLNCEISERCYYLTGEKSGNKKQILVILS